MRVRSRWSVIRVHWSKEVRKKRGRAKLKILRAGVAGNMTEPKMMSKGVEKNKIRARKIEASKKAEKQ